MPGVLKPLSSTLKNTPWFSGGIFAAISLWLCALHLFVSPLGASNVGSQKPHIQLSAFLYPDLSG